MLYYCLGSNRASGIQISEFRTNDRLPEVTPFRQGIRALAGELDHSKVRIGDHPTRTKTLIEPRRAINYAMNPQMIRTHALGLAAAALLAASSLWSQTAKELPKPSDYVSDFAHVLSPDAVVRLDLICGQLDRSKANTQVAIVTVRALNGADIADYAKKLANAWGVGGKGSNRGVLVLLAINDHKWRIAVGYGLQGTLSDSKADEIGRDMIPLLRSNDFDGAVTLAAEEIAQVVTADAKVRLNPSSEPKAPMN